MEWWAIALIAAGGLILAGAAVGVVAGLYAARKIFCRRYDGNPNLRYFQAEDFEGLKAEPVSFGSGDATLRGYIYSYDGDAKGAVIFSHGFGAGHRAYTTEIDALARDVLLLSRNTLLVHLRFLDAALSRFTFERSDDGHIATDGQVFRFKVMLP